MTRRERSVALALTLVVITGLWVRYLGAIPVVAGWWMHSVFPAFQLFALTHAGTLSRANAEVIEAFVLVGMTGGLLGFQIAVSIPWTVTRLAAQCASIGLCLFATGVSTMTAMNAQAERRIPAPLPSAQPVDLRRVLDYARFSLTQETKQLTALRGAGPVDYDGAIRDLRASERVIFDAMGVSSSLPMPRPQMTNEGSAQLSLQEADGDADMLLPNVRVSTHLPISRLYTVIAHEDAHIAGVRSETAANYLAFRSCLSSRNPVLRLNAWREVVDYAVLYEREAIERAQGQDVPDDPYADVVRYFASAPELAAYGPVPFYPQDWHRK